MGEIYQDFRITLDIELASDPVIDCQLRGNDLNDLITQAKAYATALANYTNARGVEKIELLSGHKILGFIKIPI